MKKMYAVLALAIVLTISCSLIKNSEDKLFNSGLELLNTGDYYGAVELFNQIDSLYPESPYGYYGRAIADEKDRRDIDALNAYSRMLTKGSDFAPGLIALFRLAARTDHPDLALNIFSTYSEIEDDSLAVFAINANMLLQLGEYQLAKEQMAKVTSDTAAAPDQHIFYSRLYLHDGDFENALKHCSLAVADKPDDFDILMEVGDIYTTIGNFDSAAVYYKRILGTNKINFYQKADIAEAYLKINYLADAYKLIAELESVPYQNNIVPYLKTKYLLAKDQAFWAKEYYAKTISKNVMTPAQQLFLGDVRWKSKDIQGTIMAYEHADQTAETKSYHIGFRNEISLAKPELYIRNGDWRDAQGIVSKLEAILPMDFRTIYLKSGVYLLAGNIDGAEESITRLEILVENNPYRLTKFGNLYKLADSLEKADYYYNQALKFDKVNTGAILGKVEILKKNKKQNDAIKYLESQKPLIYSSLLYPELISLYREKADLKKAREFVSTLIGLAPGDVDRYILAMDLAKADNNPEDVESIVQTCLKNNPGNGLALLLAGEYYMETGKNENAERYFQEAVSSGILAYDAYYQLGLILEDKGEVDSALVCFQKSIDINQFLTKSYGRMAAIMINKDEIDDRSLATLMNYVRLAWRGGKYGEDYITMGRALVIQENYKRASLNFNKALELDPQNPEYNYYAGMNYISLDSAKKAKTLLNKAIKNGLQGEFKKQAQNALDKL